jgi:hypothetical protein
VPVPCPVLRPLVQRSRCRRRPWGPLAGAVAVLLAICPLRQHTETGPALRQQRQRVSAPLPKKEKDLKGLCKAVAPVAGVPAFRVLLPSQPADQGLPLVPALASAGARAPCIEIPVDIGRATAYQVSV